MSALTELAEFLQPKERVEKIIFGAWGWGDSPGKDSNWKPGYGEPSPPPVPFELRGKLLTLEEAAPFMESWGFYGGYGAASCYAVTIWTNIRVIWVTEYDGSTRLDSAPRNPTASIPYMPGG